MQATAGDISATVNTEARYGWSLIVSLAVHLAMLFAVEVVPRRGETLPPSPLQVRIENSVPSAHTAPEPALEPLQARAAVTADPLPPPEPRPEPATEQPRPPATPSEPSRTLPQIEAPLVEDPVYYPARQLDVHPTALGAIVPSYPERAAEAGVGGNITLLLMIDESGVVREVSVAEANPEGWFEESAQAAFRNARFAPAQRKGRAVKSRVLIRVTYELNAAPSLGGMIRR